MLYGTDDCIFGNGPVDLSSHKFSVEDEEWVAEQMACGQSKAYVLAKIFKLDRKMNNKRDLKHKKVLNSKRIKDGAEYLTTAHGRMWRRTRSSP